MHEPLLIPIVAMLVPIVIVPTALVFKWLRRERELEHVERIRAMELGRVLPRDEPFWSPARIAVSIALAVPTVAMTGALIATGAGGYHEQIWVTSMFVAMSGVGGGTFLAHRHLLARASTADALKPPQYDPDAFDVVGRRG